MIATNEYLESRGRPVALYTDKHGVFRVNHKDSQAKSILTQFGRAAKELGIEIICANSPQAKGRVERANKTLQDRLVKELRLRNISTIEEVGSSIGVTRERGRPIQMEVLRKLREILEKDGFSVDALIRYFVLICRIMKIIL